MMDPKGGQLTESTHQITTEAKAIEWLRGEQVDDLANRLPLTITQYTATGGRIAVIIRDCNGSVIHRRG